MCTVPRIGTLLFPLLLFHSRFADLGNLSDGSRYEGGAWNMEPKLPVTCGAQIGQSACVPRSMRARVACLLLGVVMSFALFDRAPGAAASAG